MYIAVHELSEPVEGMTHLGVTRLDVRAGRVLMRGSLGVLDGEDFRAHRLMRDYVETVRGDDAESLVEAVGDAFAAWTAAEPGRVRRTLDDPEDEERARE